jgi:O-antigen ligase
VSNQDLAMAYDDATLVHPLMRESGAQRMALRVLQAGALAVVLVAATYRVFELDRFFVPKELVLHLTALLAGILCLAASRRFAVGGVDLFLAGYLALGAVSAALAQNPWAGMRALGVSASGIVVFWVARSLGRAGLARTVLVAVGIAVTLGALTSLAQTYGVRLDVFSINRAPGGTLGNRNFVAHLCAFGLPILALCALRAWRGPGLVLGAVGFAALAAVLVLTRSRAAWLGVIAALAVMILGWLIVRPVRRDGRSWVRLVILLLFAAGGVAGALIVPNKLRWNSENPYSETARGVVNYQEGSGRGRLIQYANTLRMAAGNPVLGVGPGNWPVAYPEYAKRRDPSMDPSEGGMTSNPWPSSDWVALIAERGLPAFALLVMAMAGLAGTAWRRMRTARDADEGLVALALASTLVATLVVGAFDAVLLLPLPSLLIWASLGALVSGEEGHRMHEAGGGARVLGILALLVVCGGFAAKSAAQIGAMHISSTETSNRALERASQLDPGSYRIHLRLARSYRGRAARAKRCEHAQAAHALFPNAEAAAAAVRRCD